MRQQCRSSLAQVTCCSLLSTKPLSELFDDLYRLGLYEQISFKFISKYSDFHKKNCFENINEMSSSLFGLTVLKTTALTPIQMRVEWGYNCYNKLQKFMVR